MRKWFRWIIGGNGRPSLWSATWIWKLYTFKNEISWWEYVRPEHKLSPADIQVYRERTEYRDREERKLKEFFGGGK